MNLILKNKIVNEGLLKIKDCSELPEEGALGVYLDAPVKGSTYSPLGKAAELS